MNSGDCLDKEVKTLYLEKKLHQITLLQFIHCLVIFVLFQNRNSIQDTTKTCITYDAINAAYLDARKRIRK